MRIGFTGKMGSGKTTLAQYLSKEYGLTVVSFANPLKQVVQQLYDLSDDQLYGGSKNIVDPRYGVSPRYLLQQIGTNVFRQWDPDFWVKVFERKYSNFENFVLDDIRFDNEADTIRKMGGIIIKVVSHKMSINSAHESERGIKNYDYKIYNDSDKDALFNALQELLHYIQSNNTNNNKDNQSDN